MPLTELPEEPLVSVLVANHNYGRYLPDAAESLLWQTYRNWELIVCDDGSTDDSREILDELARRDTRIRIIYKGNGGQASAWNVAYDHASGDVICLLDADDWFHERKIEAAVEKLRQRSRAGILYHRYRTTDADGRLTTLPPQPQALPEGWMVDPALRQGGQAFLSKTSELVMRREFAERIFPLPESLKGYGDAYIGRIAPFTTEVAALPEALSFYRLHALNHSAWSPRLNAEASRVVAASELIVFEHQQRFLASEFGHALADRVKLDDLRPVWDQLGALFILSGKPADGALGYSPQAILERLSRSRRKYIWRLLFRLPAPASKRLLSLWWSRSWWKRYTRAVTGRLGLGDWRA